MPVIGKRQDSDDSKGAKRRWATAKHKTALDNYLSIRLSRQDFNPAILARWASPGDYPFRLLGKVSCHSKIGVRVPCNHNLAVSLKHYAGNERDAIAAEARRDLTSDTEGHVKLSSSSVAGQGEGQP